MHSENHIFGGYADASWRGFGERHISPSPGGAFLFTLRNATGMPPTKMKKLAACKRCYQRFGSGSRLRNAGRRGFPGACNCAVGGGGVQMYPIRSVSHVIRNLETMHD